jgi:DNA modification methylase
VITLIRGDCTIELGLLAADSFDSCVCDPPYHLTSVVKRFGSPTAAPAQFGTNGAYSRASVGFMGKLWDGGNVAFRPETWAEVYRVLKPGAFLFAMAGTRTYHRMTCAIEDAGFEIRDAVLWLYGSGMPKSHDVSKGIDKKAGAVRQVVGPGQYAARKPNWTWTGDVYGEEPAHGLGTLQTIPSTAEAIQWSGWGTALKPAAEMVAVARKPLSEGTVANNMRWHGTGALNLDACRVGYDPEDMANRAARTGSNAGKQYGSDAVVKLSGGELAPVNITGRWPANVIHDGSDEVMEAFAVSGVKTSGQLHPWHNAKASDNIAMAGRNYEGRIKSSFGGDTGSAARFFYVAKANKTDRAGSRHPTVKPVSLIRYLVRLTTQPGGAVLDPFAGSGTTAAAALAEGMDATLIEMEAEYEDDIRLRLGWGSLTGVVRRNAYARKRLDAALEHHQA